LPNLFNVNILFELTREQIVLK